MAGKSIPEMVKQYAENWRKHFIEGVVEEREGVTASGKQYHWKASERGTLQAYVDTFMEKHFVNVLLTLVGVKKDTWGRIELTSDREGYARSVLGKHQEELTAILETSLKSFISRVGPKDLELTQKEVAQLRREFRDNLMRKLFVKMSEHAEQIAEQIAEEQLRRLMHDDEWVALMEKKLEDRE